MDSSEQGASSVGVCLVIGAVISFVVSYLKRFSWVSDHVKLVAFVISVLVGVAVVVIQAQARVHHIAFSVDYSQVVTCIVVQFSASVATHEVIVNPISQALVKNNPTKIS